MGPYRVLQVRGRKGTLQSAPGAGKKRQVSFSPNFTVAKCELIKNTQDFEDFYPFCGSTTVANKQLQCTTQHKQKEYNMPNTSVIMFSTNNVIKRIKYSRV